MRTEAQTFLGGKVRLVRNATDTKGGTGAVTRRSTSQAVSFDFRGPRNTGGERGRRWGGPRVIERPRHVRKGLKGGLLGGPGFRPCEGFRGEKGPVAGCSGPVRRAPREIMGVMGGEV